MKAEDTRGGHTLLFCVDMGSFVELAGDVDRKAGQVGLGAVQCSSSEVGEQESGKGTYRIANFLGFKLRIGKRVKQTMKRATAARLRPPKISRRSQRLTVGKHQRAFKA